MSLISALGLDSVTADPNDVPVGTYDGEVIKSEYVIQKDKVVEGENVTTLSHAITYKVTEGEQAGAQKQQWYTLYTHVADGEGNVPEKPEDIKAAKPALSDKQKQYYKKLYVDLLGIPEDQVSTKEPADLVGAKATFGIAEKKGYKNISWVSGRDTGDANPVVPVDPFGGANQF